MPTKRTTTQTKLSAGFLMKRSNSGAVTRQIHLGTGMPDFWSALPKSGSMKFQATCEARGKGGKQEERQHYESLGGEPSAAGKPDFGYKPFELWKSLRVRRSLLALRRHSRKPHGVESYTGVFLDLNRRL